MEHIVMQEGKNGEHVVWLEQVSDAQYRGEA